MRATLLMVIAVLTVSIDDPVARAEPPAWRVIVHPTNRVTRVDRKSLSDMFLKKSTRWPNGETVRPVDLGSGSDVRSRFTRDVLNRTVDAVKNYWRQVLFAGRGVPPPELDRDGDVVQYVLRHPGAIGYVSGTSDVGRARVVPVD